MVGYLTSRQYEETALSSGFSSILPNSDDMSQLPTLISKSSHIKKLRLFITKAATSDCNV